MGADLRKQNNTSVADIYMYLDKKSIKKEDHMVHLNHPRGP